MGLSFFGDSKLQDYMTSRIDQALPDNVIAQVLKSTEETSDQHKLFLTLQNQKKWLISHKESNSPVSAVLMKQLNPGDDESNYMMNKAMQYSNEYHRFLRSVDNPEVKRTLSFLNIPIPNQKHTRVKTKSTAGPLETSKVKTLRD